MQRKNIISLQNPLVKEVVRLIQKPQERRSTGLFVAEGVREVSLAIQAGIKPVHVFICDSIYQPDPEYPLELENLPQVFDVSQEVYAKMAYRSNAEGVLAVMESFSLSLEQLQVSPSPLLIVLESVEKPGNLGAILRTADAAGVDAVIICDPQTDIFNPNVIRSSLGCLFSVKVAVCDTQSYFRWAAKKGLTSLLASVQARQPYYLADMTKPVSLVFGTEADGLSQVWYDHPSSVGLNIPMAGKIDSLNVSASAAIFVFEAKRQRSVKQGE